MRLTRAFGIPAALVIAIALVTASAALAADSQAAPEKPASPGKTAPPAPRAKAGASSLLDLNTDTKDVMELPGIGDAYAQKIIAERPYKPKNGPVQKKIVPEATCRTIAGIVISKRPK